MVKTALKFHCKFGFSISPNYDKFCELVDYLVFCVVVFLIDCDFYFFEINLGRDFFLIRGRTVTRSYGHSVIRSIGHIITRSYGHLVIRSLGHTITWSYGHSVIRSFGHTVIKPCRHRSRLWGLTLWIKDQISNLIPRRNKYSFFANYC